MSKISRAEEWEQVVEGVAKGRRGFVIGGRSAISLPELHTNLSAATEEQFDEVFEEDFSEEHPLVAVEERMNAVPAPPSENVSHLQQENARLRLHLELIEQKADVVAARAEALGIEGTDKMNKADLIAAILAVPQGERVGDSDPSEESAQNE